MPLSGLDKRMVVRTVDVAVCKVFSVSGRDVRAVKLPIHAQTRHSDVVDCWELALQRGKRCAEKWSCLCRQLCEMAFTIQ